MTTKVINCYCFDKVDFHPHDCLLIWKDNTSTKLTEEESRLLNVLCRHAGETLSENSLFRATGYPVTSIEQHRQVINSLLSKSFYQGKKLLPIDMVGEYGFRISIPKETLDKKKPRIVQQFESQTSSNLLPQTKKNNSNKLIYLVIILPSILFILLSLYILFWV